MTSGGCRFVAAWAVGLLVLACAPAAASAAGFQVGAATVNVTPPHTPEEIAKADGNAFALCPPGLDGPRPFAFEEPYKDVNGNGRFDYGDPAAGTPPEPYCDANHNGRYDGIWLSSGTNQMAALVHDDIDARAVAFDDGTKTVVVASVVSQGLFNAYTQDEKLGTKDMRDRAHALRPGIADMFVSANHNESSPDSIGIYGAPDFGGSLPAGANSGINDYYMNWLADRVAEAAATAYDRRQPATLWARQFLPPPNLYVEVHNFPTTADNAFQPRAIDPKVGVLQARDGNGAPIVTIMSLAAHNQEIGHSGNKDPANGNLSLKREITSDWPGYFHRGLEAKIPGMAMYLVGDNGSQEDPSTVPPVTAAECGPIQNPNDPPYGQRTDGCYPQAQATGEAWANAVAAQAPKAERLRFGPLISERHEFDVPLENNGFRALATAGVFDNRPTYTGGQYAGRAGRDLRTEVGVLDVGPDLQLLANPAESFPALMVGSPWGIEDAECPNRPNPAVPTWQGHATYRFQVGLANDLIGYMIPAWAAFTSPELYTSDGCNSSKHSHGLESESVGPTASNAVANELTALLKHRPDPAAHVVLGRFVMPDGTLSRRPEGAVGIWFANGSSTSLTPGSGRVIAIAGVTGFGSRSIDSSGKVMDYDGAPQDGADVLSRGMLVYGCDGNVAQRYYLNVYPTLSGASRLGLASRGDTTVGCGAGFGGGLSASCRDRGRPFSSFTRGRSRFSRRGGVDLRGRARDRGCAGVGAVLFSISKLERHGCRYLQPNGRLRRRTSCRRSVWLRAKGTTSWRLRLRGRLPRGYYRVLVRAIDRRGNHERPSRGNTRRIRL
ncbi:MAG: hypothetical protein M3155_01875 [Actinomycetota bacterium]|nr:hypothetical protein [Actinomycetota bacterium]